jgi:hypothetical protein
MFGIVSPGGFEGLFLEIAAAGTVSDTDLAKIEARYGIHNAATRALG